MTNITIAVPEGLHARMKDLSEIRWSEVARKAFEAKVREAELIEGIAKKSRLTEKDVRELAGAIDKKAWERIKRECA